MRVRVAAAALVTVAVAVSCSADPPVPVSGPQLADAVDVEGVYRHLVELQDIADTHDGNRADGSLGYEASVDYVVKVLRDSGFDVETPEFERVSGVGGGNPELTVSGETYRVEQVSSLVATPPGGLRATAVRPWSQAGCAVTDYDGVSVEGAIAVVDDTGCSIVDKQNVALAQGAVGLLVVSRPTGWWPAGAQPGLLPVGYYRQLTVPVGMIDTEVDAALLYAYEPVTLVLDNQPVTTTSRNVIAQTRTGDPRSVVMVGAHLDSVRSSPGINDNGSGVAVVLETALKLGGSPQTVNMVRFAFWGAEEVGLEGARSYLRSLDGDGLDDIALYLNFDMLGSPNPGFFTDDGDQSMPIEPREVPEGSAGIERILAARLAIAGRPPADIPLGRTTDYAPFLAAGIPFGGVTTGSSQVKNEEQASMWGGQAGVAFDPNYHTPRDTIDNVDRDALAVMASTVAYAVGTYAESAGGVNGVPPRDQRDRRKP